MAGITEFEFLNAFYNIEDEVCMRIYSDRKEKKIFPKMYKLKLNELEQYISEMHEKNVSEHCGVHFTVNYGGQFDKDIKRINAVFFENDTLSFNEQLEMIARSPLEPSIIVKTRKSLHCYFLVDNFPMKKYRNIQERLAIMFQADAQIKNESRNMRMPGFFHMKKDPIMVKCVKFDPDLRYTYNEINSVLPPAPPKPKKITSGININIASGKDLDSKLIMDYVREKLEISYEREDKIVCRCLFPEKHSHGDTVPSAVFFKGENAGFFCSGCGSYYPLYDLAEKKEWNDLKAALTKAKK